MQKSRNKSLYDFCRQKIQLRSAKKYPPERRVACGNDTLPTEVGKMSLDPGCLVLCVYGLYNYMSPKSYVSTR